MPDVTIPAGIPGSPLTQALRELEDMADLADDRDVFVALAARLSAEDGNHAEPRAAL